MQIAVVGTGYVGLVAGTCFAEMGNHVICVDVDQAKVDELKAGGIPIYEPGLEEIVRRNSREGRLDFTTDLGAAVQASRVIFIAVGTPPAEDGSADISVVLQVAEEIGAAANGPKILVDKSTVPVGTAAQVKARAQAQTEHEMMVVSNPEFLKEGAAIDDFLKPDRVVVGADSDEAFDVMDELYSPFVRSGNPILHMDPVSAEMTKYAANAMLATRISFMNDMARLCELVGADVDKIRKGVGSDRRIGGAFLYPGVGYGGSCFPKDVQAIRHTARELGHPLRILDSVEDVNADQKLLLLEKAVATFGEDLSGLTFAVWGLAFKPRTDDMREAPAIPIVRGLLERGASVRATDPEALIVARGIFGDTITYCEDPYDSVIDADAILLVTEWNEFRRPDFSRLGSLMKRRLIFDGRNIYSARTMKTHGFERYGVGVPPVTPAD